MTSEEMKTGLADLAFRALDRFGVACVILAVVLWFAREAAVALHETLVKPVVASHVEFLETTRETLSEIGAVQQQQANTLEELADGQREVIDHVKTVIVRGEVREPAPQN